ncbi:MAG TPA: methyltransferase domain-containing protein [Pyrinomonadaceae bacterium]|jgi:SAM-dependent methyltransferase
MSIYEGRVILAPYVATPDEVVGRMLELAGVSGRDVVLDLGCGDGRVCIAVARRYGARSIGVDIEPYWVELAAARAAEAGVSRLTTFRAEDACETDLSAATVITLYLGGASTQAMGRRLRAHAAPGARVVSHHYPVNGWEARRAEEVPDGDGKLHRLYLWRVGARGAAAAGED